MRVLLGALVLLPFIALAQETELRAQIRADLRTDPRSAELTAAEFDELVELLAEQAANEGVIEIYVADRTTFSDYSSLFVPSEDSFLRTLLTSPFAIAFAFFGAVVAALGFAIYRRGRSTPEE